MSPRGTKKFSQNKIRLHNIFNVCFKSGLTSLDWSKSDIKPIPKPGKDQRVPLYNRPISIICCIAKVYSFVLDCRVKKHLTLNDLLCDTQNGFRARRSCVDHIFSLITILRNFKSQNKQIFLCFVDFRRAFDSVNRPLLFYKISSQFGIVGNMYSALSSLYKSPLSRVVLGDYATDWFNCPIGVKQGDCISPTLFTMFINDLATELNQSGVGISLDMPPPAPSSAPAPAPDPPPDPGLAPAPSAPPTLVNSLLYADDLVCLASKEEDLQFLINIVNEWCIKWRLDCNLTKTSILHVRKTKVPLIQICF